MLFDTYPSHLSFYKGECCESCNFSGFKGRTLISEIFVIDKDIGSGLSKGFSDVKLKRMALESGMKSMLDDGLMKLHETTLSEILRIMPHELIKTFRAQQYAQEGENDVIDTLFDSNGGQTQTNISQKSFIISNPKTQVKTIIEMLKDYNNINAEKMNPSKADLSLFKEFITESYYKICDRFNCHNVSFIIQDNKGRAEITALPEN
jgi:hypothetical protein